MSKIGREADNDALDAARWRALLSSQRIRALGTQQPAYSYPVAGSKYLAIEFWSESNLPNKETAIPVLLDYVDALIAKPPPSNDAVAEEERPHRTREKLK